MKSNAKIDDFQRQLSQQFCGDEEIDTTTAYIDTLEECKAMTEDQIRHAIDQELYDDRDCLTMTRIQAYEWALEDDEEEGA